MKSIASSTRSKSVYRKGSKPTQSPDDERQLPEGRHLRECRAPSGRERFLRTVIPRALPWAGLLHLVEVVAFAVVLGTGCSREEPWVNFHSPDGRFTVLFPSKPQRRLRTEPQDNFKLAVASYIAGTPNGIGYAVPFFDYPKDYIDLHPAEEILEGAVQTLLKARPEGRRFKSKIQMQGYPGRSVFLDDPVTHYNMIVKCCMVQQRFYIIQAVKKGRAKEHGEIDRFFDSFKIDPVEKGSTNAPASQSSELPR